MSRKVTIIGAGSVGSTITYTMAVTGLKTEFLSWVIRLRIRIRSALVWEFTERRSALRRKLILS